MKDLKTDNWDVEDVRKGVLYFHELHSRVPRLKDFQEFEFLPSEAFVKREFGSYEELWGSLGYRTSFRA